jgi:hypothetical protein
MLQIILFPPLFGGYFKNRMPTLAHVQFSKTPPFFAFHIIPAGYHRKLRKRNQSRS